MAIFAQYPWLDNGQLNGPVPAELLVPFSQFINTHNLSELVQVFNGLLYFGGMGDWNQLETYYALRNLAPTIAFLPPNGTFVFEGGCESFYKGMKKYITQNYTLDNVWTDTTVTRLERPQAGDENNSNKIKIKATRRGYKAKAKCSNLIIAFAQTLANIDFLDIDLTEENFFSSVTNRVYGGGVVSVTGGIASATSNNFTFVHLDFTRPFEFNHTNSGWVAIQTTKPYAPASFYYFANDPTFTRDQLRSQVTAQFDQIVAAYDLQIPGGGLFSSYDIRQFFVHEYFPHPNNTVLNNPNNSTGFFTGLENLQGRRNTYWVGALHAGMSAHHSIMDKVKRLVDSHF
jgi:hypothetical protein